jgi:hypothetical protein
MRFVLQHRVCRDDVFEEQGFVSRALGGKTCYVKGVLGVQEIKVYCVVEGKGMC